MGKLSGIISKINGSAGNITFRRLNGETVVSEKVTQVRNPRSEGQMRTRTRFTNIVAMYKVIGNAVPCKLAEVIGKAIMEQAFGGADL